MSDIQNDSTLISAADRLHIDSIHAATHNFFTQIQDAPEEMIGNLLEQGITFALKVLAAIIVYCVGAWIIRRVKKILNSLFQSKGTEKTLASFITSLTSISMTIMLIITTVSTLGVNTTSLAALLAAGGMAIGMALSGTVQNFAGGIMLLIFKPFKAEDFISIGNISGVVKEISIVYTKILTVDNRVVVLPNGALSNGNIDNYFTQPLRRINWTVSVEYGASVEQVQAFILDKFKEDGRILTSASERPKVSSRTAVDTQDLPIPNPTVRLESMNANDISFIVKAWVKSEDYWDVFYDYNEFFYTNLPKQGIHFAYPHMDVTIKNQ